MPLIDCTDIHGHTTLFEHNPSCETFRDVLYMPVRGQRPEARLSHGLYSADGTLIRAAGRFRGPDGACAGPELSTAKHFHDVPQHHDTKAFFYLGLFTSHYGHFLIDTLCRLWALGLHAHPTCKILYHGNEDQTAIMKIPFVRAVLEAVGISADRLIRFNEPTVLQTVTIASPSFEELNFSHRIFAREFNAIGARISTNVETELSNNPVYLTKMNVKSGISRYVNEDEFVNRLSKAGVDIISPETLDLAEQINIFKFRRVVSGLIGSAFHTSVFVPGRSMLILNYGKMLWANQVLIDKANNSKSTFVYDSEESLNEGPNGQFGNNFRMSVPDKLAEDFLRRIDAHVESSPVKKASAKTGGSGKGCAAVLFVKNEASDIAAWFAWHRILGFDSFVVFDDDSTDGTPDILHSLAKKLDIRVYPTKGRSAIYQQRQVESYIFAISEFKSEFSWMAFFDADEYLQLGQDSSVKAFLARFPDADAVAINWCNYGSGGHLLKPDSSPVEAYTWHGDERQKINRHVKSIVRPDRVGPNWVSVHHFDIAPERSVLSNGMPTRWSDTIGIIDSDPDWSVARLMHFQCRSMENFIERLKKRPELAGIKGIWQAYNLHDAQTVLPPDRIRLLHAEMKFLSGHGAAPINDHEQADLIFDIGMAEGNDAAFYLAKGFRVIGVEPDAEAYYLLQDRFARDIQDGRLIIHNMAAAAEGDHIIEFFRHNIHQRLSGLNKNRPEFTKGSYRAYHVLTIDWSALIAEHGVPHYAKIDIEGQEEEAFLSGLKTLHQRPAFISVDCYSLAPAEALFALGYRQFKLVDQDIAAFSLPPNQDEGNTIVWTAWHHMSGPFGRDLIGEWLDFDQFKAAWHKSQVACAHTWFDCHAWLG